MSPSGFRNPEFLAELADGAVVETESLLELACGNGPDLVVKFFTSHLYGGVSGHRFPRIRNYFFGEPIIYRIRARLDCFFDMRHKLTLTLSRRGGYTGAERVMKHFFLRKAAVRAPNTDQAREFLRQLGRD